MRKAVTGVAILLVAMGFSWGVLLLGQHYANAAIAAVVGEVRTPVGGAAAETVFDLIIFAPLLIAGLVGGAVERRNAAAPGARGGRALGLGLLIGFAGLSASVAYAWLAGSVVAAGTGGAPIWMIAWGVLVVLLQTGAEEIFFRGWLQPALTARWGMAAGILAAAMAFAALHIAGAPEMLGPVPLVNLFLGGLMFGLLAARGGGIAAAVGVHWAWNGAEQLLYGLDPNPGVGGFGSVLDKDLVGSAIWGGTPDGLNGSVGMTFALLAILAPLGATVWRRLPGSAPQASPIASALPG